MVSNNYKKEDILDLLNIGLETIEKLRTLLHSKHPEVSGFAKGILATICNNIANYAFIVDKLELLEKILNGEIPKEEAPKITCHDNLAFCCGPGKPCFFRDVALKVLDIDRDKFFEEKKKFGDELLNKLSKK